MRRAWHPDPGPRSPRPLGGASHRFFQVRSWGPGRLGIVAPMSLTSFEIDDRGVARLTLDRPDVRNAFNAELIAEISDRILSLPVETRVLVLAGAGKAFSAGADLNWMKSMASYSQDDNVADSKKLQQMFSALDHCRVPVVGRIHGAAIAGATGLVACCDIAVASEETLFAFTEVKIGLIPAVISPFVVRKVGYAFARSAFLTAERFDARRAYEVGLVHKVVPLDSLESAVDGVVADLLAGGPEALRQARILVDSIAGRDPDDVADRTIAMIAERRTSEEGQEGIASFLEKRKPRWSP